MVKVVKHTTTTEHNSIELHEEHIRKFLKSEGIEIPREAEVVFTVPSGGDWSGMDVDLDLHNPIHIRWTERHES